MRGLIRLPRGITYRLAKRALGLRTTTTTTRMTFEASRSTLENRDGSRASLLPESRASTRLEMTAFAAFVAADWACRHVPNVSSAHASQERNVTIRCPGEAQCDRIVDPCNSRGSDLHLATSASCGVQLLQVGCDECSTNEHARAREIWTLTKRERERERERDQLLPSWKLWKSCDEEDHEGLAHETRRNFPSPLQRRESREEQNSTRYCDDVSGGV